MAKKFFLSVRKVALKGEHHEKDFDKSFVKTFDDEAKRLFRALNLTVVEWPRLMFGKNAFGAAPSLLFALATLSDGRRGRVGVISRLGSVLSRGFRIELREKKESGTNSIRKDAKA